MFICLCYLSAHWIYTEVSKKSLLGSLQFNFVSNNSKSQNTAKKSIKYHNLSLFYLPSSILLVDNIKYNFTFQKPASYIFSVHPHSHMEYTGPYHLLLRSSRCIGGKENGEPLPASVSYQQCCVSSAGETTGKLSGPSDPFLVETQEHWWRGNADTKTEMVVVRYALNTW